jgi:hypothetical protein
MLVDGKERGKGRVNPFTPALLHKSFLMEFPMLAGGEWEEKERRKIVLSKREK